MSVVNFGEQLTLKQAAQVIAAIGTTNRVFLEGEPGIGKSSLMGEIERVLGDEYHYCYFDCANKDLGDITMPAPNHELKVTEYFPNAVLGLQTGKKLVIMLDEFTKAFPAVQNMLHPMLEAHNPRLGDDPLPEGSIIFLTGNLQSDGVGDSIKGHSLNRITRIKVAKPTSDEWLRWGVQNDIEPSVLAWVRQFPHCLASYTDEDGAKDNPYIYNPRASQLQPYVSPRSLALASNVVAKRDILDTTSVIAALTGTIGAAAAKDMEAYLAYHDDIPSRDDILDNPKTAKIPESAGATAVLTFKLLSMVESDTMDTLFTYVQRLEAEWQAVFAINLAEGKNHRIAFKSRAFEEWVTANQDII
jgi:hypothetical protein